MTLTLHELSIGASLQRPISKQDIARRDDWMDHHTDHLFSLAKEALLARDEKRKAARYCDECGRVGDHDSKDCPFPAKHIPLFPCADSGGV